MENYLMLNGKKIELTEEQVKILTKTEKKKDIWNPQFKEEYYSIDYSGTLSTDTWTDMGCDYESKEAANCCTDRELMEKRALQETLNRLLWRFTLQNGWNDELWTDYKVWWTIAFYNGNLNTAYVTLEREFGVGSIYYRAEEIAQRAIDEIVKPFIEEHHEIVE